MSWTDNNDKELQKCLDRLLAEQKHFESKLRPIGTIINNIKKIQSKEYTSFNEKRERQITKILPKDKWGADMTDESRLRVKDECVSKTIEILGEIPIDN